MARRRANEGMTDVVELGLQFTPMIDCIFQLIIFFMVNVKFRTMEGLLKAFLPRASTAPAAEEPNKDKVFVTISEPSAGVLLVAVNNQAVGGTTEREQYAALERRLRTIRESLDKMPPVIIHAGARIPYKYVIYALNVCGKLKLEDVMFMFPQE
jgi:biopolymer transport protein ExbD